MNWLDVLLALVMAISVATAFAKGFSRLVVGLLAAVGALVAGVWLYSLAGSVFLPYARSRGVANLLGFLVVFLGILLLGGMIGHLMSRFMKAAGLSFLDRVLGAGFGVVRGLLVAAALVLALMAFTPGDVPPRAVARSRFAPYVIDAARAMAAMAPYELKQGFRRSYEQLKKVGHERQI